MNRSDLDRKLFDFFVLWDEKINRRMEENFKGRFSVLQFRLLADIHSHGSMTMSELGVSQGIQKQQMTKVINQLVEGGYAVRVPDASDRRVVRVELTERARGFLQEYMSQSIAHIRGLFAGISDAEFSRFMDSLESINGILQELEGGDGKKRRAAVAPVKTSDGSK